MAYNFINALGWGYILVCTLIHIFALDSKSSSVHILSQNIPFFPPPASTSSWGSVLGWVDRPSGFPAWALQLEQQYLPKDWIPVFRRMATTGERLSWQTTVVQTFAIMEVVHSLLGWVRSPLVTVLMQVASRYYAIYGVNYLFPEVRRTYNSCPRLTS